MAQPLVSDALWAKIKPLLPPPKPRRFRFPGRKPLDPRKALTGIIFVLKSGIPWELLPQEMGCGSGMACWNYLAAWHQAGVWERLHQLLLAELQEADRIDWSRAAIDSSHVRALGGGEKTGKNPTDRGKLGTKHHLVTDGQGIPLAVTITGSNVPDVKEALHVVDKVPAVPGRVPSQANPRLKIILIGLDAFLQTEGLVGRKRQSLRGFELGREFHVVAHAVVQGEFVVRTPGILPEKS